MISKAKLPQVVQGIIRFVGVFCFQIRAETVVCAHSSLASPDSETLPNNLVIVTHGASGDLARLEDMKISQSILLARSGIHSRNNEFLLGLPHNMLVIDTAMFERSLYNQGLRPLMVDPKTNQQRQSGTTLSLENLLRSFAMSTQSDSIVLPNVQFHNSGNDAFMCLFALQMLLDPRGVKVPTPKRHSHNFGMNVSNMGMGMNTMPMTMMAPQAAWSGYSTVGGLLTPSISSPVQRNSVYDLSSEFGQMRMASGEGSKRSASRSPGPKLVPGSASSRRLSGFRFGDA